MRSVNAPSAVIIRAFAVVAEKSSPIAKSVATEMTSFMPFITTQQSVTAFESFAIAIAKQY